MPLNNAVEKEIRVCRDCGNPLGPGREDRLYCDDGCRTNYNNRIRREKTQAKHAPIFELNATELSVPDYITRIQHILLDNRRILEDLCHEEKPVKLKMRDLIGRGFNTKFFTSQADPAKNGNVYRFCFEFGYLETEDKSVVIVRREREVEY